MIIEVIQETEGVTVELTPMNVAEEKIVREASVYAKALDLDLVWWGDTEPPNPENEDERLSTQGIKIHVKQQQVEKGFDIAVWEMDLAAWEATRQLEDLEQRIRATLKLEPTKIWGEKHPFIPRKGEEVQIDHSLYEVVGVSYDLGDDHIRILVVKLR